MLEFFLGGYLAWPGGCLLQQVSEVRKISPRLLHVQIRYAVLVAALQVDVAPTLILILTLTLTLPAFSSSALFHHGCSFWILHYENGRAMH